MDFVEVLGKVKRAPWRDLKLKELDFKVQGWGVLAALLPALLEGSIA